MEDVHALSSAVEFCLGPLGMERHLVGSNFKCLDANFSNKGGYGTFKFHVSHHLSNASGKLFGGSVGSVADFLTSAVMMVIEGKRQQSFSNSVSTYLGVEYLKAANTGDDVIVHACVEKFGKTTAFTSAYFYECVEGDKKGDLLYKATHQKVLQNIVIPKDLFPESSHKLYDALVGISKL